MAGGERAVLDKYQAVERWFEERQEVFGVLNLLIVPVFLWLYWLEAAAAPQPLTRRVGRDFTLAVAVAAMVTGEGYERPVGTELG
jgi:hypothetical protein